MSSTTERRAAVALAGRRGDQDAVRVALGDGDAKVRAGAFGALVRLEVITPNEIAAAITDESLVVRRTICELARPGLVGDFASLLFDPEPEVVEAAAYAVGETGDRHAVSALGKIATTHRDALCREAAVAALGAIGDPEGKAPLLAALRDTNYIRRRAVVALAAFSGADVDAALEEHRSDRDWQVRQAVEDVTGANRQIES